MRSSAHQLRPDVSGPRLLVAGDGPGTVRPGSMYSLFGVDCPRPGWGALHARRVGLAPVENGVAEPELHLRELGTGNGGRKSGRIRIRIGPVRSQLRLAPPNHRSRALDLRPIMSQSVAKWCCAGSRQGQIIHEFEAFPGTVSVLSTREAAVRCVEAMCRVTMETGAVEMDAGVGEEADMLWISGQVNSLDLCWRPREGCGQRVRCHVRGPGLPDRHLTAGPRPGPPETCLLTQLTVCPIPETTKELSK